MTNPEVFLSRQWEHIKAEKAEYIRSRQQHIDVLTRMVNDNMFPPAYFNEVQKVITEYKRQIKVLSDVQ